MNRSRQLLYFLFTHPHYTVLFVFLYIVIFALVTAAILGPIAVVGILFAPLLVIVGILFYFLELLLKWASDNPALAISITVTILRALMVPIILFIQGFNLFQTTLAPIIAPIWNTVWDLLVSLAKEIVKVLCVTFPPVHGLETDCPLLSVVLNFFLVNLQFIYQILAGILSILAARTPSVTTSTHMFAATDEMTEIISWFLNALAVLILLFFDMLLALGYFMLDMLLLVIKNIVPYVSLVTPSFSIDVNIPYFLETVTDCSPVALCFILLQLERMLIELVNLAKNIICFISAMVIVIAQFIDRAICYFFLDPGNCLLPLICSYIPFVNSLKLCPSPICSCISCIPKLQVIDIFNPNIGVPCDIVRFNLTGGCCINDRSMVDDIMNINILGIRPVYLWIQGVQIVCPSFLK